MTPVFYRHTFLQRRLVELFFHGKKDDVEILSPLLQTIHSLISPNDHSPPYPSSDFQDKEYGFYLQKIATMILYFRDSRNGPGERSLAFYWLFELFRHYPSQALELIMRFLFTAQGTLLSHGWKDVRKLAEYIYFRTGGNTAHPILQYCVFLMNAQLSLEKNTLDWKSAPRYFSDVSRWIPRETSSAKWLFHEMALDWSNRHTPYLSSPPVKSYLSVRKYRMNYRHWNRKIRQHVPSAKNLGPKENGWPGIGLEGFVLEAQKLIRFPATAGDLTQKKRDEVDRRWKQMVSRYPYSIGDVLPILDISREMEDAWMGGIGVACFLLSRTTLEKRVLLVDQTPCWLMFDAETGFVAMVAAFLDAISQHGRTVPRIDRANHVLLRSFLQPSFSPESCRQLKVVFLSNSFAWLASPHTEFSRKEWISQLGVSPTFVYWNVRRCRESLTYSPTISVEEFCATQGVGEEDEEVFTQRISGTRPGCARALMCRCPTPFDTVCFALSPIPFAFV